MRKFCLDNRWDSFTAFVSYLNLELRDDNKPNDPSAALDRGCLLMSQLQMTSVIESRFTQVRLIQIAIAQYTKAETSCSAALRHV